MLLPVTEEGQERLAEAGLWRPIHRGPHPSWSNDVEAYLEDINIRISRDFAMDFGPARDVAIWLAIVALEARLRQEALRMWRIVEDDRKLPIQSG
jgi:hypothetical protein